MSMDRRSFIGKTALAVGGPLTGLYVSRGQSKIMIGFIPLTDCGSVVMAQELGLYKKYGVDVEVSKEASWPNVRDKILNGELKAATASLVCPSPSIWVLAVLRAR
jgi:nitrate/nitrite transport system substrate-binding protein